MAKFLIHIHSGPENPTKAALGFLVALTALKEGHSVELFLAGDGASLIGDAALSSVEGKAPAILGRISMRSGTAAPSFMCLECPPRLAD